MRIRWRGLELPNRVTSERPSLTDVYGKFTAEPFERGFGMTVGNSIRRILLSSLEGSAVTRITIQGVQHEISTIPGVVEDVTDIVLNIKSLVVKNMSDQPKTIRIDKHGAGEVRAADIQHDESVQIVDPDHHICTMTADVPFVMEMTVENGRGYRTADENLKEREIGTIPVDSSFSPVVRVKYDIEETRVGQKTNYDKLVMEIWTNGTVSPQMALVEAAKILRKHLNPFIQYSEPGPEVSLDDGAIEIGTTVNVTVDTELERKLNMSLAELELSVRATNCLESEGITTVRDLVIRSDDELLEVRNFGETTLKEVKGKLTERGLHLGMKIPQRR